MQNDARPTEGDTFECTICGMQILITKDCQCDDGAPFFTCCGTELSATGDESN